MRRKKPMTSILVIEDEEDIRLNLLKMLQMEGFEVVGAENGRIGVHVAKEHLPDLIICDIIMPELNGYGVLAELRSDSFTATIPFIFLTAKAETGDFRKGMALGADDYIMKPFEIDELLAAIRTRLEKHKRISESASAQKEEIPFTLKPSLPRELRTPLTTMIDLSAALTQPASLPESDDIVAIGKVLHEKSLDVQRLIENNLFYADLRVMKYESELCHRWQRNDFIDTESFIAFLATHEAIEARRQKDLHVDLTDAGIRTSARSFQKILRELLNNAFKFSEPGTPVRVKTTIIRDQFQLTVTDQGSGLTRKQLTNVMTSMKPENPLYERPVEGLGLIISHFLTRLCGGELTIETLPNRGTTVTVVLKD
jgi:CheY-like chemotaxis protein